MMKQRLALCLQRFRFLRWFLSVAVRAFAPTNYVGVMAAVFNDAGQVLLVKHVFRPDYPWGLPGGWIERGEDPELAIQRELKEELNLVVEVKQMLFCQPQGVGKSTLTPLGLGIAYYCRVADDRLLNAESAHSAYEVLQTEWLAPAQITWKLARLHQLAVNMGQQQFLQE